ncbi:hypothetical protein Tco_1287989 [Tanacetum coccineum]
MSMLNVGSTVGSFDKQALKTELISKISSGSIASEKPKVRAPGMYDISPKYIPPQRRVNRAIPIPLPKK